MLIEDPISAGYFYQYDENCDCAVCVRTRELTVKANESSEDKISTEDTKEKQYHDILKKAALLWAVKSNDYGNKDTNLISSIENAANLSGITAPALLSGIIANKLERISSLTTKGREKKVNESLTDTALDIVNYAVFLTYSLSKEYSP